MKKLLALVLALVMTLGLATVGANAALKDYSDADSIDADYKEAFAVLNAVGVFTGSDGQLTPTANLTRAQAAKLVAYLDLGETVAEALPAVAAFDDVPATFWGAKYIAYCKDAGIIGGVGGNKFDPDAQVTGYAFGKMMLCVLGYDATIEGYGGDGWEIHVATAMEANGINADVDKSGRLGLTREEAAQFCLNTLQATCVEYADKGTTVAIGDATVTTGAKKATAVAARSSGANKIDYTQATGLNGAPVAGTNQATLQLCEKLYGTKLLLTTAGADELNRPAEVWKYKTETVATGISEPAATFTAKTSAADVAKALSGYRVTAINTHGTTTANNTYAINNTTVYAATNALDIDDGNDGVVMTGAGAQAAAMSANGTTIASAIAAHTANGKLVQVFANTNKVVTKIVEVTYTVEKVKTISKNAAGDVSYNLSVSGTKIDYADNTANTDSIEFASTVPVKDDYVTTTVSTAATGSKTIVYPTTTITGTQTANTTSAGSTTNVTVGGTSYKIGVGVISNQVGGTRMVGDMTNALTVSKFDTNTTSDNTYYVDQYGFLVAHEKIDTTVNYAVVDQIAATTTASGINSGSQSAEAVLVFADGSKKTVEVSKLIKGTATTANTYNTSVADGDASASKKGVRTSSGADWTEGVANAIDLNKDRSGNHNAKFEGKIVTYEVDSDGKYELTYPTTMVADDATAFVQRTGSASTAALVTKGVPAIANDGGTTIVSGTSSTQYIIKTTSGSSKVFTAYTGFANVATVDPASGETVKAYFLKKDNALAFVYIDASALAAASVGDDTSKLFYATGDVVTNGTSTKTYSVEGYLDGVKATVTSKSASFGGTAPAKDNFYSLLIRDDYVTTSTAKTWNVTGTTAGKPVTSAMIDEIDGGSFDTYLWNDSTKVYVIDTNGDINAYTGKDGINAIAAGDTYYADLNTSGTDQNKNTFKQVYVIQNGVFVSAADVASITAALASSNAVVVNDNVNLNNTFDLPAGQSLTIYGNLTVSSNLVQLHGNVDVYGKITVTAAHADLFAANSVVTAHGNDNQVGLIDLDADVTVKGSLNAANNIDATGLTTLTVDDNDTDPLTTATLAAAGTLNMGSKTLNVQSGAVTVDKLTSSGAVTFAPTASEDLPKLTINHSSTTASTAGATTITGGTLTVNADTLDLTGGSLTAAKSATIAGAGTVKVSYNDFTVSDAAETVTLTGNLDLTDGNTGMGTLTGKIAVESGAKLKVYELQNAAAARISKNNGLVEITHAYVITGAALDLSTHATDTGIWLFDGQVTAADATPVHAGAANFIIFKAGLANMDTGDAILPEVGSSIYIHTASTIVDDTGNDVTWYSDAGSTSVGDGGAVRYYYTGNSTSKWYYAGAQTWAANYLT